MFPVPLYFNADGKAIVHTPSNATVMFIEREVSSSESSDKWSSAFVISRYHLIRGMKMITPYLSLIMNWHRIGRRKTLMQHMKLG
jgi:hypothetical protein